MVWFIAVDRLGHNRHCKCWSSDSKRSSTSNIVEDDWLFFGLYYLTIDVEGDAISRSENKVVWSCSRRHNMLNSHHEDKTSSTGWYLWTILTWQDRNQVSLDALYPNRWAAGLCEHVDLHCWALYNENQFHCFPWHACGRAAKWRVVGIFHFLKVGTFFLTKSFRKADNPSLICLQALRSNETSNRDPLPIRTSVKEFVHADASHLAGWDSACLAPSQSHAGWCKWWSISHSCTTLDLILYQPRQVCKLLDRIRSIEAVDMIASSCFDSREAKKSLVGLSRGAQSSKHALSEQCGEASWLPKHWPSAPSHFSHPCTPHARSFPARLAFFRCSTLKSL